MHPRVFALFDAICADLPTYGDILEIGVAKDARSLLECPSLARARRRVGVGLDPPDGLAGCDILQLDSNDMSAFTDASFDLVLSNSTLEHDIAFWLTLREARRVLRPGGWLVIGVPGFGAMGSAFGHRLVRKLAWARRWPVVGHRIAALGESLAASSPTLGVHNFPSDYFRFSRAAMHDILLGGLDERVVEEILDPPRFIGFGRVPMATGDRH